MVGIAILLAMIPASLFIAVQIPSVQTKIAQWVIGKVEPHLDGNISIDKVAIALYDRIIINNILITGTPGDTLVHIGKLSADISAGDFLRGRLYFDRVYIEDGIFHYIEEGSKEFSNITRIFKIDRSARNKSPEKSSFPHIKVDELRINNYGFHYVDCRPPKAPVAPGCMDYTNIVVSKITGRFHNFEVVDGAIEADIKSLAATEKCGIELRYLTGHIRFADRTIMVNDIYLKDNYTTLIADYLSFSAIAGKGSIKDFLRKIALGVDFKETLLDFRTIGFFTPELQGNSFKIYVTGEVTGPIAHLVSDKLSVHTPNGETVTDIKLSIKGIPNMRKAIFDVHIPKLRSNTKEIDKIVAHFTHNQTQNLTYPLLNKANCTLNCNFLGTLYDFKADGKLLSTVGDAEFDVDMEFPGRKKGAIMGINISTDEVELGNILKSNSLGNLSADADLNIKLNPKGGEKLHIGIDSLYIHKLGFNQYDYTNLFAVGKLDNELFDGRIIAHDPNLHLLFQGIVTLHPLNGGDNVFNFYADIPFADLQKLNIDKRGIKSQISLRTMANLSTNSNGMFGNVDIKNVTYWGAEKEYNFGAISMKSAFQDTNYIIDVNAPFLQANLHSTEPFSRFKNRILDKTVYSHWGDVFTQKSNSSDHSQDTTVNKGRTEILITTADITPVCEILLPNLYISDNSTINFLYTPEDSLMLDIHSPAWGLGSTLLSNFKLDLDSPNSTIFCNITSDKVNLGGNLEIEQNLIKIISDKGVIDFSYLFDNEKKNGNKLDFSSQIGLSRTDSGNIATTLGIDHSDLFIRGLEWHFTPSVVELSKKRFTFDNFSLQNKEQFMNIDGTISSDPTDTISVAINRINLSFLDKLLKRGIDMHGIFSGQMYACDLYGTPSILMDMDGDSISVLGQDGGSMKIMSKWDQERKRMNILAFNRHDGLTPLNIVGYYQPKGKFVNLDINFRNFALRFIEPFTNSILQDISGSISGDIELLGPLGKLTMTSKNTRLNQFKFTPEYTKVPYTMDGPIGLSRSAITLSNIDVYDRFNNKATVNGTLRHNSFTNFYLDAALQFENFECLNTTEQDNQSFYGSAYGSGLINLTGPFNNLLADVIVSTSPKTAIHVPLSSASSATQKDLLKFTSASIQHDPYTIQLNKKKKIQRQKSNFTLQAKASISNNAELFVEINKQLGDILRCRGNGNIDIAINPAKEMFDLKGDYTIDEGSYKLVLLGITAKDFIIDNGGTINFNGDIRNTNLDVGATYQTKASVSTLIADTSSVGNRRSVDCGIHLSGPLADPNVSFSVDVQDLDPITKGRVESALSTDDKVQKQFMALILSGSFIPDEQSGIFNNSTILYSNAGEMLSNQFNNVFRQLGIPLDLGLNYQPAADGKTHDMFDVALSYQAFNNRVIINGNVGTNQNSSQTWGGNFEAEVKLDKNGKMRMNAFTRSADDYSNYLDNTQRNGIGFTYQDEFDTFRELLRNIFWSKKRKEAYETQRMLEAERALENQQSKE